LLELPADANADDAQAAFHKIARTSHPDLHRNGLTPEELEMVTSAYASVAGAYQELRTRTMPTARMKPLGKPEDFTRPGGSGPTGRPVSAATPPGGTPTARATAMPSGGSPTAARAAATPPGGSPTARPAARPTGAPAPAAPIAPGTKPETAMSQKALLYYRKAELALKRGDLKGAILQLKLACATDPASQFLRSALAEVETEVRKTP
jgi:hypothetical protein